jgi:hypothetical protein
MNEPRGSMAATLDRVDAVKSLKFPTYQATTQFDRSQMGWGLAKGRAAPMRSENSAASCAYLGSSSNFRLVTISMNCLNAGGLYRHSDSALVAIFFLHTR